MRRKEIERHLTEAELDQLLGDTNDEKMIRRLIFVKNLYRGDTIEEAAARVGKSPATGSRWTDRWNDGGPGALAPNFGGGRPPKLDDDERVALLERLRAGQPWHPRDVRSLLETEFDVEYHPAYLSEFLRSLGLQYTRSIEGRSHPERTERDEGKRGWWVLEDECE